MSIKLSDSIRVGQQKPLEDKYFNELVPYTSTSQVNTLLLKSVRHIGLTVNINGEEYWYKDGIEDDDLIFKSNQKTIEITREELYNDLIPNEKLEPNRLYKITGIESWCFSQHLIKAIYLKAITNNTLESEGVGEFYTPKYNELDDNLGIWKGELLANGMISSASYNIGDKVIWGNLFWENISGNIGTNEKDYYDEENDEWFFVKSQNLISETDWQLITPNDDESLYNIQFDSIKYNFQNDYINYRADNLGNVYEISYSTLLDYFPNNGIRDFTPEFIYDMNSIALFQWGRGNTSNNIINESIVLNCNYNVYLFQKNIITENSKIFDNNFFNVNIVSNNVKNSSIVSNYLKRFGGIIENNLEDSIISSNKYYFEIRNNILKNNSSISNNNDNNIIVNINYSIIKGNSLDNNSTISNNIFVEEGKGISGYRKGIYDNILTTYCNINSNTIKNGSRIFGHKLEYYSTINGNILDTDANIYYNQLVQNGKIDNNILTGHGRIYGNQLDRTSEITNCKLRIFPTTSYATTIKNNRLFTGKIQNIDFGNIVNPVGSDPNNPAFGGNALSECIIENESIIKDLTFTNNGGIGIQFVKMNGYSEFKNITINDSIKNVDFINTIFNETSDYSKLIEGSGYQTNGFTKTYIDGVLLQDKFNAETLDVITDRGNTTSNEITVGGINTDYVQLDTTSANVYDVGKIYWNGTKGTYNFGLKNNVELQLGQEQNVYGKAYSAITNGQLVMYRTSQGGHILFEPANFTQLSTNPDLIIGVATQDIALNEFGYITTFGEVNTLNTSSFADGNTLYFGSGNVLQNTVPSGSYFIVGRVNRSHATQGSIFVKPYFVDSTKISGSGTENYVSKFTASGTVANSQIFDNGTNVGIGTINPINKFTILGADDTLPTLGSSSGKLGIFNRVSGNPTYGMLYGVLGTGSSYIQSQRVDGTSIAYNLLLQPSGGNVSIGGITTPTEKLDVNGYTKSTGFKTPTGTATQSLTADGGTFDLNDKADLVDGKVPSSQLPSYVDDVLEFANLASFPAAGESGKIYIAIDTNLTYRWGGSSYVVMSSSLALGETSSTAYRGDRGKTAYDHSQTTGNPHDTELEELTDVSGDATTIEDTDVILKKESGGLWKKITFANFKNWFTTELAKKINIGLDTVFNFKNISAMTLTQFKALTPNLETIYFTEEQNATGWQQIKYNGLGISIPATTETLVSLTNENYIELDSDSSFNLIDVANTKINGIFEKDFVIIKFNAGVVTPATANQWFKLILKVNNVQTAVSPVFYLTETSGTIEQIAHNFALNVPAEMVTNGATLHLKTSVAMTFNNPAITVVRVHKSTNANF